MDFPKTISWVFFGEFVGSQETDICSTTRNSSAFTHVVNSSLTAELMFKVDPTAD